MLLVVGVSCQQKPEQSHESYQEEEKQKVSEFSRLYFEVWENEYLDSLMTFLDEEFINMFAFGSTQTKEQCWEPFKDVIDSYSIEDVEFRSVEIFVDKNYAFQTGLLKQKWITNDKQDTIYFDMRGLNVYKKQEDGSWKLFRSMGQQ